MVFELPKFIQPERVDYDRDDLPVKLLSFFPSPCVLLWCRVPSGCVVQEKSAGGKV